MQQNKSKKDKVAYDSLIEMRALGCGRVWCAACGRKVNAVTIEQASTLTNLPVELLLERIRNHGLHFRRRLRGFMICLESLIRFSRSI